MPSTPIILPIIITGIVVGSLMKSKTATFPKKRIAYASLASGLLNALYAYGLYLMTPRPTFARAAVASGQQSQELIFTFSSFVTGVLVVLAVVGIAKIFIRFRGGQTIEEADVTAETESESTPP